MIDSGLVGPLWEGYHESRRCSRDTSPESYITKHTSIPRFHLKRLSIENFLAMKFSTRFPKYYWSRSGCVVNFIARKSLNDSLFIQDYRGALQTDAVRVHSHGIRGHDKVLRELPVLLFPQLRVRRRQPEIRRVLYFRVWNLGL